MAKRDLRTVIAEDYPEFHDEIQNANQDQLNDRLAELAKNREEIQDQKESDEVLEEAKARASELAAPYRDAQKLIRLKSRFIIMTLKDRGQK